MMMMMRSVAFIALVAASVEAGPCANRCDKCIGSSSMSSACRKGQSSCKLDSCGSSFSSCCVDEIPADAGATEVEVEKDSLADLTADMVQIDTEPAAGLGSNYTSVQINAQKGKVQASKPIVGYTVSKTFYLFSKRASVAQIVDALKSADSVYQVGATASSATAAASTSPSSTETGTQASTGATATDTAAGTATGADEPGMSAGAWFGIFVLIVLVIVGAYFAMAGGESEEGDETEEEEAEEEA